MNKTVQGVLLMIAAMAVFTVLDSSAKVLMHSLNAPVAVFFRYAVALGLSLAYLCFSQGLPGFKTYHPFLQGLRGVFLMGSTFCNFIAMSHLQLAQTAAISFTIPLWVCALSVPLLGEHVGLRRWLAVLTGLAGVLVITRPGSADFHWAMILSVGSALMGALYNLATRRVGGLDKTETSLFYVSLFGCLTASVPLGFHWQLPEGQQWVLILLMGLAGAFGHFMLIQAHRLTAASALAPFAYTQIIWMTAAGYVVFGDVPDGWTLAGAAIVVASGIYVYLREAAQGKLKTVADPGD